MYSSLLSLAGEMQGKAREEEMERETVCVCVGSLAWELKRK